MFLKNFFIKYFFVLHFWNLSKKFNKLFNNLVKKRAIAFIISDFIENNLENALKITAKKHDLIALRIFDKREKELPNTGNTLFEDGETGQKKWINTGMKPRPKAFNSKKPLIDMRI